MESALTGDEYPRAGLVLKCEGSHQESSAIL
jgi:hypothetical protein